MARAEGEISWRTSMNVGHNDNSVACICSLYCRTNLVLHLGDLKVRPE